MDTCNINTASWCSMVQHPFCTSWCKILVLVHWCSSAILKHCRTYCTPCCINLFVHLVDTSLPLASCQDVYLYLFFTFPSLTYKTCVYHPTKMTMVYGRDHSRNILWDTADKNKSLGTEVQHGSKWTSCTSILGPVWLVQQQLLLDQLHALVHSFIRVFEKEMYSFPTPQIGLYSPPICRPPFSPCPSNGNILGSTASVV